MTNSAASIISAAILNQSQPEDESQKQSPIRSGGLTAAAAFGFAIGALFARKPAAAFAAAAAGALACIGKQHRSNVSATAPEEGFDETNSMAAVSANEEPEQMMAADIQDDEPADGGLSVEKFEPMPAVSDQAQPEVESGGDSLAGLFFPEIGVSREPPRARLPAPLQEIPDEIRIDEKIAELPPDKAPAVKLEAKPNLSTVLLKPRPQSMHESAKITINPIPTVGRVEPSSQLPSPSANLAPDKSVQPNVVPLRAPVQKPRRHMARKKFWQWWK